MILILCLKALYRMIMVTKSPIDPQYLIGTVLLTVMDGIGITSPQVTSEVVANLLATASLKDD